MSTRKTRSSESSKSQTPSAPAEVPPEEAAKTPSRQERAAACREAIKAALAEHGCRIVPYLLDPEPVGAEGNRVMLTATYGLVADG